MVETILVIYDLQNHKYIGCIDKLTDEIHMALIFGDEKQVEEYLNSFDEGYYEVRKIYKNGR